ncbi:hypothetical protein V8C86DRAFT_2556694 [Haematococcus lacustris]
MSSSSSSSSNSSSNNKRIKHDIDRRHTLLALCCVPALHPPPSQAFAAGPQTQPLPACSGRLSGPLAAAFLAAVYAAVVGLGVMDEQDFQRDNFKLRDREYNFYLAANKGRLPALPDLEDGSGGLSEPLYFDFVNYCAWKVAARQLRTPSARSEFSKRVAQELLAALWPQGRAVAQAAAQASSVPGLASEQAVVQLVTTLLEVLQSGNYLCRYQLVWGEHPGGWPQDWMVSQPTMAGAPPSASSPAAPDTVFQVKLHRPADLEGCVALRSEEEDGWWSRTVSLMISLLLKEAGYSRAEADEFFYQDAWQGPTSLQDQLLLFIGDPLEQVGIDFKPSTLVQNWQL